MTSSAPAVLGIELGSTRIKACVTGPDHDVLAVGSHSWENRFEDGRWTYSLEDVWDGLRASVSGALADHEQRHGAAPEIEAIGVSAMMHGYLALDAHGELLTPFRTWRNTSTGPAAAELTDLLGLNIPLRWSVAHLLQAALDGEDHVSQIAHLTTLAGYVHERLTGERVVGAGDASGMFPIAAGSHEYDGELLARADARLAEVTGSVLPSLRDLLPASLPAGTAAGHLTAEGARLLDGSGTLRAGIPLCPPEGDAGTGMVATNAVAPRTGNVSVGTSIFAMLVLEGPLAQVHHEIDMVTTPDGAPVAMVHCNNGASELAAWAGVFGSFASALGHDDDADRVFEVLLAAALEGAPDGGGLLAYNYLAGEPITGLEAGRPLLVRTPESELTLANLVRAQLYGVFGTLSLGMRILAEEGVQVDALLAHGGLLRTAGVAQRMLAAATGVPIAVGQSAAEGGAWGIAVLARYLLDARSGTPQPLAEYLAERVFQGAETVVVAPDAADVAGYAAYLERYEAGLAVQHAAIAAT